MLLYFLSKKLIHNPVLVDVIQKTPNMFCLLAHSIMLKENLNSGQILIQIVY